MGAGELTVFPGLTAGSLADGRIILTRKFIDGMLAYAQGWPGPIKVCMESGSVADNLDNTALAPADLPFRVVLDCDLAAAVIGSALVLGTAGRQQSSLSKICREHGVPCVYVAENSLRTRLQAVKASTRNPVLRLRRSFWETRTEWKMRSALRKAAGVQCNGTPTFKAYRALTDALLYFDTRTAKDQLISHQELDVRLRDLERNLPLRLVFSGRLARIKGADHLIDVARLLQERAFPFRMSICGDGELAAEMKKRIGSLPVEMKGVLDFHAELQPFLKQSTDLFVCCHRQGDPSCTYLETLACGLPIVSYDNEAFTGLLALSNAGWAVPMDRPDLMAQAIAALDRSQIAEASRAAIAFASRHTFESVFDQRLDHLRRLSSSASHR